VTTGAIGMLARGGGARLRSRRLWLGLLGIAVGLAIWVAVSTSGILGKYALASPAQIAARFERESGYLLDSIWMSFVRVVIGYSIGCGLGIAVAIAASWAESVDAVSEPVIQVLKPVPPLVLTPFMVIWFGAGDGAVLALTIWGTFFLMVVEGREALRRTPKTYRWAAATLGDTRLGVNLHVMLPASVPRLIGGLRIAMVLAINLVILAEFSVASGGIGDLIVRGYRFLRPDQLFFGIIVAVGMAVLLDVVIRIASLRLRRWV
jgi:ABC-type nitrate/sulfonate/bicarbonate transport system permease component